MNEINTHSSTPCYLQPTTLGHYEHFIANFNSHHHHHHHHHYHQQQHVHEGLGVFPVP